MGVGQSWDGQESQCEPQAWGVSGPARPGGKRVRRLLPVLDTPSGPWELLRAMVLGVSLHVGSQEQWKGLLHHSQHSAGRLDRSGGSGLLRLLAAFQGLKRVHGPGGHRQDPIDWVAGWTTEVAWSHRAGPEGLPFSLRPRAHCPQQHFRGLNPWHCWAPTHSRKATDTGPHPHTWILGQHVPMVQGDSA